MNIVKGARLIPVHDTALNIPIQVEAVRHNPIAYAEVQPLAGGRRRVVSLTDLERDFRIVPT